jgi:hypothetical protein
MRLPVMAVLAVLAACELFTDPEHPCASAMAGVQWREGAPDSTHRIVQEDITLERWWYVAEPDTTVYNFAWDGPVVGCSVVLDRR